MLNARTNVKMLYVVGDSDSVYISQYLIARPMNNTGGNDVPSSLHKTTERPNESSPFATVDHRKKFKGRNVLTQRSTKSTMLPGPYIRPHLPYIRPQLRFLLPDIFISFV